MLKESISSSRNQCHSSILLVLLIYRIFVGYGTYEWALDSIWLGGLVTYPNILYDNFDIGEPAVNAWMDHPGASVKTFCHK